MCSGTSVLVGGGEVIRVRPATRRPTLIMAGTEHRRASHPQAAEGDPADRRLWRRGRQRDRGQAPGGWVRARLARPLPDMTLTHLAAVQPETASEDTAGGHRTVPDPLRVGRGQECGQVGFPGEIPADAVPPAHATATSRTLTVANRAGGSTEYRVATKRTHAAASSATAGGAGSSSSSFSSTSAVASSTSGRPCGCCRRRPGETVGPHGRLEALGWIHHVTSSPRNQPAASSALRASATLRWP